MQNARYCKLVTESMETRTLLSATTVEMEPNDSNQTATIAAFDPADSAAHLVGTITSR